MSQRVRLAFGTDGVRGVANSELGPELALALGRAAARVLGRGPFVVGRDTRISGPMLQSAFSSGLASEGVEVFDLGVIPTPGVARVAASRSVPAAVISASHNPFPDNGVKLLGPGGTKLTEAVERQVEEELTAVLTGTLDDRRLPTGPAVGRLRTDHEAHEQYRLSLLDSLEGRRLNGLRVVLDCANGAATTYAPDVFRRAGAEVVAMAVDPDGVNINAGCGSTHPQGLQAEVVAQRADVGLAFDGDADRVLAVDGDGALIDGDQLMAICALDLKARGLLAGNTVAVSILSNLGFRLAMEQADIGVHETPVGDRHLSAALDRHGWVLGGEQSGHIIFHHLAPTGDGMLTGLQLLDVLTRSGRSLADLAAAAMTRLPQVMRSVRVSDLAGLNGAAEVWAAVGRVESDLGPRGRVVLRASGTEPLVRVMVEASDPEAASDAVDRLCAAVESALGTL